MLSLLAACWKSAFLRGLAQRAAQEILRYHCGHMACMVSCRTGTGFKEEEAGPVQQISPEEAAGGNGPRTNTIFPSEKETRL